MGILMKDDEPYGSAGVLQSADMEGATSSKAGTHGLVPAPAKTDTKKLLKGDGTWGNPEWGQIEGTLNNQTDLKNRLNGIDTRVDNLLNIPQGSTTADAALYDIKTGFDGVVYPSPAAMVQGCDTKISHVTIDLYWKLHIQPEMTSNNWFNDNGSFIEGYFLSAGNGSVQAQASYSYDSNYYPIKANTHYVHSAMGGGAQFCFYDLYKNFISGIVANTLEFTTPSNAVYIRYSFTTESIPHGIVNEGYLLKEYDDYSFKGWQITKPSVANKSVDVNALYNTEYEYSANLFDPSDITDGYIFYANGNIAGEGGSWYTTGYIPVKPNTLYTQTESQHNSQMCWFDEHYQYISGLLLDGATSFTSPATAAYLRTDFLKTSLSTFGISEGSSASSGPYSKRLVISPDILPSAQYNRGYKIVSQDGTGDYTTLSAAVTDSVSGDIIFVKAGIYDNEEVHAWEKDITIIGEDPLNTIIKNGYNTYSKPPLEMSCGVLKNITIEAYDGGEPSQDPNGWKAYGIHIDNTGLANNTLDIEDCIIKCDLNAAVGIGLMKNGTLRFVNCKFYGGSGYSFYFHDAASTTWAGNEYIIVKDCYGVSNVGTQVVRIDSQKTVGANVYPVFINNIFVSNATDSPVVAYTNQDNTGGQATTVGTFNGLINFYQSPESRNNYPESLNYVPAN